MAKSASITVPRGEEDGTKIAKAAESTKSKELEWLKETLIAPLIFEDLEGAVRIEAETIDTVFGNGCVRALGKAQIEDKLYPAAYKSPDSFKNFKATINGDKLLWFNERIVVPLQFRWFGKLFTRTLIEYVHLKKVHVGARDTLAGLKRWFWEHQAREVKEFVKECDECQRAKHHSTVPPGLHVAVPTSVSGFKHVALDFQGPLPVSKDVDGVEKTALWNILARGTGYL